LRRASHIFCCSLTPHPPRSTLFPYTTLFRSQPHIDRDLLIAGALLHDIGKVREIGARAGFPYTDEGKLLGHIVLGMQMVAEAAAHVPALTPQRLTLLQHLIASQDRKSTRLNS